MRKILKALPDGSDVSFKSCDFNGPLDLEREKILGNVTFENCRFNGLVTLRDAQFPSLWFVGCQFLGGFEDPEKPRIEGKGHFRGLMKLGIEGKGLRVDTRFVMYQCWSDASVDLSGTHLAVVELDGSTFQLAHRNAYLFPALTFNIATIDRSLNAPGLRVFGEFKMLGTKIGGQLNLQGSCFNNTLRHDALTLREANIARSLHAEDIQVVGRISAAGLVVGGEAEFARARVAVAGGIENEDNHAIDLLGASTGRWLNLRQACLWGGLRLSAAKIGGMVSAKGTRFALPASYPPFALYSIEAAGLVVARDFELANASLERQLFLPNAKIGASLALNKVTLAGKDALFAAGASIADQLDWAGVFVANDGTIDLEDATVTRLVDEPRSWKSGAERECRNLVLSGFTYKSLGAPGVTSHSVDDRIRWIRQEKEFDLSSYRTAAAAFKSQGQDKQARKVLVTGERDRLIRGGVNRVGYLWGKLLSITTGFGYELWRTFFIFSVIVAVSAVGLFFCRGEFETKNPAATPKSPTVPAFVDAKHDRCPQGVPCFNAIEYAVGATIPALSFDETSSWKANSGISHAIVIVLGVLGFLLAGAFAAALGRLYLTRDTL